MYASGDEYTGGNYQWVLHTSNDGGASWSKTVIPPAGQYEYNYSFAQSAANPSIMYMGGSTAYKPRVRRSADGGATWSDITRNLASLHPQYTYAYALWISPTDPDNVLVGTSKGVFNAPVAGGNWNATPLTEVTYDFAYYAEIDTLYAATGTGGVYMSEDQGATWTAMNDGLDTMDIMVLDLDRKNGYLYAGSGGDSVWRVQLGVSLTSDVTEVPAGTGGVVNFALDATADNAGRSYFLLGSVSGTEPGFPLPGGLVLPLNWDVLTGLTFKFANTPIFADFQGTLDGSGGGTAKFDTMGSLPPNSVGAFMYYAYLLYNPYSFVSNPVAIEIVP